MSPSPSAQGVRAGVASAAVALLLGACSLLPGGGQAGPEDQDCAVRVENHVDWGLRVVLNAPDPRPPVVFAREIRYLERDDTRFLNVPCTYGAAYVQGDVRRVSGLSGMQRTRFRSGVCLVPGDTAVAYLDEYAEWVERWWEDCPAWTEPDTTEATSEPDTAGAGRR